jgi:hypothetical protein
MRPGGTKMFGCGLPGDHAARNRGGSLAWLGTWREGEVMDQGFLGPRFWDGVWDGVWGFAFFFSSFFPAAYSWVIINQ